MFIRGCIGGIAYTCLGMSCAGTQCSSAELQNSTKKREPMSTANTTYNNDWYTDELGWFERGGRTLINGLESFYKKTGVQPYVYLYRDDGEHVYQNPDKMEAVANELYNYIFGHDEGHLLFVYFACPGDSPDVMDGDYIFMFSDGILDHFPGEEGEELLKEIVRDIPQKRPNDMASHVMKMALMASKGAIKDDTTILVMGVWENKH